MSRRKVEAISNGVFLICLGILFYTKWWWPGILIAVWATFGTRQVLTGRYQDLLLTSILLLSLFVVAFFNLSWDLLMPVLFVISGGYLIFREFIRVPNDKDA